MQTFINKYFLVIFLGLCLKITHSTAQNITWNTASTGSVQVTACYGQATINLTFTNTSGSTKNSGQLKINLPIGIKYVAGSLVQTSGPTVAQSNITDLNVPIFSVAQMQNGSQIMLSYKITASCATIDYVAPPPPADGGDLENIYTFTHNTGTETTTAPAYTLLYPSLSFFSVSNSNYTGQPGQTYQQSVTMLNAGGGNSSLFFLALNPPSGLSFSNPSKGTINASKDTIWFSGTALGADNLLTPNEQINVTYDVFIKDCSATTTSLALGWGCNGQICRGTTYPISANILLLPPNLIFTPIIASDKCLDVIDTNMIRVVNTGGGVAVDVEFDVLSSSHANNTILRISYPFDTASLKYKIGVNGTPKRLYSYQTANILAGYNYCNTSQAGNIGSFKALIPFILPNDTVFVYWENRPCLPTNECAPSAYTKSWIWRTVYKNSCKTNIYDTGPYQLAAGYDYLSAIKSSEDGPPDVFEGQTNTFNITITPHYGVLGSFTDDILELKVTLPNGLIFDNNVGDIIITNANETGTWLPQSTTVVGKVVTFRFLYSAAPATWSHTDRYVNAILKYKLRTNCAERGGVGGTASINYEWTAEPKSSCTNRLKMGCVNFTTVIHCPGCTRAGISPTIFNWQRKNLGLPDNDNNSMPDATGSLNLSKIQLNSVVKGDTIWGTNRGILNTDAVDPYFEYMYAEDNFTGLVNASSIYPVEARVRVYDYSASQWYNFTTVISGNGSLKYRVDVGAGMPTGFLFQQSDTIEVTTLYVYNYNQGSGSILNYNSERHIYAAHKLVPTASVDKFECSFVNGKFNGVGYYYTIWRPRSIQVANCAQSTLEVMSYLSIGPCCSNYAGGNYFKFEVRRFGIIDSFQVEIPLGFELDLTGTQQMLVYRSAGSGLTSNTTYPLTNPYFVPNTRYVRFATKQIYQPYGGSEPVSDEGFYTLFTVTIRPTCEAPGSVLQTIYLKTGFKSASTTPFDVPMYQIPSNGSNLSLPGFGVSAYPNDITYTAPNIDITPITPTYYLIGDTAVWEFRVQNFANNSAASNTFFTFENNASFQITDVRQTGTSIAMTPTNALYQLGTFVASEVRNYTVKATISTCNNDSIGVSVGWDCKGYPANLLTYNCKKTKYLKVQPAPSDLYMVVTGPTAAVSLCDTVPYEVELSSTQPAAVKDITIQVNIPSTGGIALVSGTVQYQWPLGSAWQSAPNAVLSGSTILFSVTNYNAQLQTNGLPGTSDLTKNKVKIKFKLITNCNFQSGYRLTFIAKSSRPCGQRLPNLKFKAPRLLINGLTTPSYLPVITASADSATCSGTGTYINMTIVNNSTTASGGSDSLSVELPEGFVLASYLTSDSYGYHAPTVQPTILTNGTIKTLLWKLQPGIVGGDSIRLRFRVLYTNFNIDYCQGDGLANISIYRLSTATCITDNSTCSIKQGLAAQVLDIPINRPNLNFILTGALTNYFSDATYHYITLDGTINNTGASIASGTTTTMEFYCDSDNSGTFTTGDVYLSSHQTTAAIPKNGTIAVHKLLTVASSSCLVASKKILAVFRNNPCCGAPAQCYCGVESFSLTIPSRPCPTPIVGIPDTVCIGGSVNLVDAKEWETWSVVSGNPAAAIINAQTGVITGMTVAGTYVFKLSTPACSTNISILVYPKPLVSIAVDQTQICTGGFSLFTATKTGGTPDCGLQWQYRVGTGAWIALPGETSTTYTSTNLNTNTQYRAVYNCVKDGCCN